MLFDELVNNIVTETITFRGKRIDVRFTPERITAADFEELRGASEAEASEKAIELLAKGIEGWSLEVTPGEDDFPPTAENLSRPDFPQSLLLALFDRLVHLQQSATGKLKTLGGSANG